MMPESSSDLEGRPAPTTTSGLILLITDRPDDERDALARAWECHGGEVLRLGRFWSPPSLDISRIRVYGSTSFVLVLREKLGVELCTPPDDLILSLPDEALRRRVRNQLLADAESFQYPLFVKPVVPKLFGARVYANLAELQRESHGLAGETAIFTSDAVTFVAEARAFILEGKVLDCAFYEGDGNLEEATAAAAHVASSPILPRTLVVDIGLTNEHGWVVVELNPVWGSGLNGCAAERVWPCIAAASGPSRRYHREG